MAAVAKVRKRGIDDLGKLLEHRQGDGPDGPAAGPRCRPVRALQHGRSGARSIGRSSGRRGSRSAMAAPTTSWSSTCARSGSRTISRPSGRSGPGPRPRLRRPSRVLVHPVDARGDRPGADLLEGGGVDLVGDRRASSRRSSGCGAGHERRSSSTRCGTRTRWRPGSGTRHGPGGGGAPRSGPASCGSSGRRFLWVWAISQTGVPGVLRATVVLTFVKCFGPVLM